MNLRPDGYGDDIEVVFMVIAHQQPQLVHRLIDRLNYTWSRTIIHIDAGVEVSEFIPEGLDCEKCLFLSGLKRKTVKWGTWDVVDTTFRMLEIARRLWPSALRFCLLSGSDFPVVEPAKMRQSLLKDVEYIRIAQRVFPEVGDEFSKRITGILVEHEDKATGLIDPVIRPPIAVFHGSTWWCLTRTAINEILHEKKRRPDIIDWFKKARFPDEMLFQTLIRTIKREKKLVSRPDDIKTLKSLNPHLHGAHYIDWSLGGAHPRILDDNDFDQIRKSGALFARKFSLPHSEGLLDRIEHEVFSIRN